MEPAIFVDYADEQIPAIEAQRFAPGHIAETFGVHGHAFHEIVIFACGSGVHRVGSERRPARRGAIDVVGEGVVHDLRELRNAEGWMLMIRADALGALGCGEAEAIVHARPSRIDASDAVLDRLLATCAAIEAERTVLRPGNAAAIRALTTLALIELARLAGPRMENVGSDERLARLVAVIDAGLAGDLRLPAIAEQLGYTPAYLTADVRRRTGRTVMEWVVARRLHAACRRLLETNDAIELVARDAGFVDASHLARHFRRRFNTSPTAWRRAHRRDGDPASP